MKRHASAALAHSAATFPLAFPFHDSTTVLCGLPTTTQQLDWYDPNALHSLAYQRSLIVLLVNSTISDVVAKEYVTYDALLGILDRWIASSVDWDQVAPFQVLGLDEIALTKGHH
jgi:hypothetical protein